ncbi:MAG: S8 family serine peptidase, partial [Catalinimonas sp.]
MKAPGGESTSGSTPAAARLRAYVRQCNAELGRPLYDWTAVGSKKGTRTMENDKADSLREELARVYRLDVPAAVDIDRLLADLRQHPDVVYAEPHYVYEPMAYQPSDPEADSTNGRRRDMHHLINSYAAWAVETGDADVTIGILDTGFDWDHPDLVDNIAYNVNDPIDGIDNDGDGYVDNYAGYDLSEGDSDVHDTHGHGTRVAGFASATFNNATGVAGLGGQCRFLPIKVFGDNVSRNFRGYEGIVYAADQGCDVINLSWGRSGGVSNYEQDIINYAALAHDVVVVASSGNDGNNGKNYPSSYNNVLSVTSVGVGNRADQKSGFAQYNDAVDLSAPGEGLYTTNINAGYIGGQSGTSFASPLVAGAAALVRAHFPDLNAGQVAERLKQTTDDISAENPDYATTMGTGRLNVYRALTDSDLRAVTLKEWSIGDNGLNTAWPGDTVSVLGFVENLLDPIDVVGVKIRAASPFVTFLTDTATLGPLQSGEVQANDAEPFRMVVQSFTPMWHREGFQITLTYAGTDGEPIVRKFTFFATMNQDYVDLHANEVRTTITSQGNIGFNDTRNMRQGIGFEYGSPARNILREAGLMVARDPVRVSDCVRNNRWSYDRDFARGTTVRLRLKEEGHQEAYTTFADDPGNAGHAGVSIAQRSYAWADESLNRMVLHEYRVTNTSGEDFDSLMVGLFVDWNVGTATSNVAHWDAERRLAYVVDETNQTAVAGTALISPQEVTVHA